MLIIIGREQWQYITGRNGDPVISDLEISVIGIRLDFSALRILSPIPLRKSSLTRIIESLIIFLLAGKPHPFDHRQACEFFDSVDIFGYPRLVGYVIRISNRIAEDMNNCTPTTVIEVICSTL